VKQPSIEQFFNVLTEHRYSLHRVVGWTSHNPLNTQYDDPNHNTNYPMNSFTYVWKHEDNPKHPDIVLHHYSSHRSWTTYGAVHTGEAVCMRAGIQIRGTKEHQYSASEELELLLQQFKVRKY
jgi:hypothetical protein